MLQQEGGPVFCRGSKVWQPADPLDSCKHSVGRRLYHAGQENRQPRRVSAAQRIAAHPARKEQRHASTQ